jgi:hypothetical protein
MGVYVAEINGRGIAAVNADQISDAEGFVKNAAIQSELMVLENDGAPLWDGDAAICMRAALPEEQAAWQDFQDHAARENKIDRDKLELRLCFLVPVIDPTDPVEILCQRVLNCS